MRNILIIDDDRAVRSSLSLLLKKTGYQVSDAEGPDEALRIADQREPDLFVLDMNFSRATSGEEGLQLLRELKSRYPERPVILITAWGSIPLAVEGMKAGASDFITKPWNNDRFIQSVNTALSLSRQTEDVEGTVNRQYLDQQYNFDNIIGADDGLLEVLRMAGRVAGTDAPVLIIGGSGTGKELIAEAIHANSARAEGPFVKVNLGGIPTTLFESEMFGHKKGAFTDAVYDRTGRFEMADGGTIFLDEIGDLDSGNQVKLLRVLQDKSFEILGTSRTKTVDFRFISATNCDLDAMVGEGRFREDLFYRINLVTLRLPPLRERRQDIPLLVNYFVNNLKTIYRREGLAVSSQAHNWLAELNWPGNVRELKNLVERTILISSRDLLEVSDFQDQMSAPRKPDGSSELPAVGSMTIEEMEQSMIKKALEFHGNNMSKVARSLGLSRGALYRRLEKYGIGS
ncbi:MAG: sigma-54-dependent Fis family transcriptional regulator [Candidatus Zixiibacteriota bacterium]|nr:MAG: sigma-54-dependent Fis family transcriptional regulator [candidate division Zixibacteria bacterium]